MSEIRHGTLRGYTIGGCRCDWCRMANRAYHGADMARRAGRVVRAVGPETLTEQVTLRLTGDELDAVDALAAATTPRPLSRQAFIRRCVVEAIELQAALERAEAQAVRRAARLHQLPPDLVRAQLARYPN